MIQAKIATKVGLRSSFDESIYYFHSCYFRFIDSSNYAGEVLR